MEFKKLKTEYDEYNKSVYSNRVGVNWFSS